MPVTRLNNTVPLSPACDGIHRRLRRNKLLQKIRSDFSELAKADADSAAKAPLSISAAYNSLFDMGEKLDRDPIRAFQLISRLGRNG